MAVSLAPERHPSSLSIWVPMNYFLETQDALAELGRPIRLYTSMMSFIEGLLAGSYGIQSAEPNLIPYTMRRLADAVVTGDVATAGELYLFVYNFMRVCSRWAPSTARWLKMGLKVLDLPGSNGVLREPYLLPGPGDIDAMHREFERLGVAAVEAESRAKAPAPR